MTRAYWTAGMVASLALALCVWSHRTQVAPVAALSLLTLVGSAAVCGLILTRRTDVVVPVEVAAIAPAPVGVVETVSTTPTVIAPATMTYDPDTLIDGRLVDWTVPSIALLPAIEAPPAKRARKPLTPAQREVRNAKRRKTVVV